MRMWFSKLVAAIAVVAVLAVAFNVGTAAADDRKVAVYGVTISNLTPGQPFTPPVLVTHTKATSIFTVGEEASFEIQQIAENGNNAPLLAALAADRRVFDFMQSPPPLVPAGTPGAMMFPDSNSYVITGSGKAKFLSIASMLICTNDGFTGLDSLRLPKRVGDSVTVHTAAYDAGTEINTEDFADIVPPCQGLIGVSSGDSGTGMTDPALAEGGVIAMHAGIIGGDDLLPAVHGWTDPVARIEVVRHANIRVVDTEVEIEAEFEIGLSGDEEVPSVVTTASGEAKVELEMEDGEVELEVEVEVCGIVGVVAAHIHGPAGPAGFNAGVMLGLFGGGPLSAGGCTKLVDRSWDEGDLASGLTLPLADFVASLISGNAYINVHTLANLGGEIRGQLVPKEVEAEFEIPLVGHQEVPRVLTGAWGEAEVELEMEDGEVELEVEVKVCRIVGVVAAHIHGPAGPPGVNDGVMLGLFGGGPFSASGCRKLVDRSWDGGDLASGLSLPLADFVASLLSGNAYINVHTLGNLGGEIRGQLG